MSGMSLDLCVFKRTTPFRGSLQGRMKCLLAAPLARTRTETRALVPSASIGLDLLPSGLYRRPRSFTGSWDKGSGQWPVDRDELLSTVHYALFTALLPRGLYRRSGIGKSLRLSLTLPRRSYSDVTNSLALRCPSAQEIRPDFPRFLSLGQNVSITEPGRISVPRGQETVNSERGPADSLFDTPPHQSSRRRPLTRSKCRSRLKMGRACWRQSAAIHASLEGIGVPDALSSVQSSA
jgi:hypothetical protein